MTEANQKKLYDNFVRLSKEGKDETQRKNCARYAADILKSFPDFAKKEEPKKELTPAQKAAATKAANKVAEEAKKAKDNSKEEVVK